MEDPRSWSNKTEAADPQTQSVLYSKLPTELRWMIYELALEPCDEEVDIRSPCTGTSTAYVPLLLTSKLVSQESKAIKKRRFNECQHHRIRITLPLPYQAQTKFHRYNPLTTLNGWDGSTTHDMTKFREIRFLTVELGENVPISITYHFNPPYHVSFTMVGNVTLQLTGGAPALPRLESAEKHCVMLREGRPFITPMDIVTLARSVRAAAMINQDQSWFTGVIALSVMKRYGAS